MDRAFLDQKLVAALAFRVWVAVLLHLLPRVFLVILTWHVSVRHIHCAAAVRLGLRLTPLRLHSLVKAFFIKIARVAALLFPKVARGKGKGAVLVTSVLVRLFAVLLVVVGPLFLGA